jgi:hypothetical protein
LGQAVWGWLFLRWNHDRFEDQLLRILMQNLKIRSLKAQARDRNKNICWTVEHLSNHCHKISTISTEDRLDENDWTAGNRFTENRFIKARP